MLTLCYNSFSPVYSPMGKYYVSTDDLVKSCKAVVKLWLIGLFFFVVDFIG